MMISKDKYNIISPVLKAVTQKVCNIENQNRGQNGEAELGVYQEGFSIAECFSCRIDNTTFYFACNYSFLKVIKQNLISARNKYPELFGTENAPDVLEALYRESMQQCSKEEYSDYLKNYACCYLLYEEGEELSANILRIDLYRLLKPNAKNPENLEFVGGFLHALDHFSVNGQNLATENDHNDVPYIDDILIYIAKGFLEESKHGTKGEKNKVKIVMDNGKELNCAFYWDDKKNVYFIKTIHRLHDATHTT